MELSLKVVCAALPIFDLSIYEAFKIQNKKFCYDTLKLSVKNISKIIYISLRQEILDLRCGPLRDVEYCLIRLSTLMRKIWKRS